jgi:hypothetical protein
LLLSRQGGRLTFSFTLEVAVSTIGKRTVVFAVVAVIALLVGACTTTESSMTKDDDKMMAGPAGTMPVKYAGYLMDAACGVPGKGMDGVDVAHFPQDHTTACLVDCTASGFGISIKDGMAYKYIPFDKAGSDLANQAVLKKTTRNKGVAIEVEGMLSGGILTVKSIKETDGMM